MEKSRNLERENGRPWWKFVLAHFLSLDAISWPDPEIPAFALAIVFLINLFGFLILNRWTISPEWVSKSLQGGFGFQVFVLAWFSITQIWKRFWSRSTGVRRANESEEYRDNPKTKYVALGVTGAFILFANVYVWRVGISQIGTSQHGIMAVVVVVFLLTLLLVIWDGKKEKGRKDLETTILHPDEAIRERR